MVLWLRVPGQAEPGRAGSWLQSLLFSIMKFSRVFEPASTLPVLLSAGNDPLAPQLSVSVSVSHTHGHTDSEQSGLGP